MDLRLEHLLEIAKKRKQLNNSAGRGNIVSFPKKKVSIKMYDDTLELIDEFASEHNLNRTQVVESLVELLPYINTGI